MHAADSGGAHKHSMSEPRHFTEDEIEYLVDFVVPARHLPRHIAVSIARRQKEKLVGQLKHIKLVPELIEEFKDNVMRQHNKCTIQPGVSVGILTAQSIGERQTQSTLNVSCVSSCCSTPYEHVTERC